MMRRLVPILAASTLLLAPLDVRAADLVVWWEKGFYPQADDAVAEIVAAFEQKTGKQVELDQPSLDDIEAKVLAAISAGQPPDFVFGQNTDSWYGQWADEDRLIDLSDVIGPFANLFDPDALRYATLGNATTGRRAIYALPMGFATNHIHVWRNLLEQAGFTLDDIPKQWEAFWSFWCDKVQPAVRKARGRDDIYGVGLAMSAASFDTLPAFKQFMEAYKANYVTREGKLAIDDPEVRRRLIRTMDSYTAIYRKGCTPPASVGWDTRGNNQAFVTQTIAMTVNMTLSIPNALRAERPEDYHKNAATIDWPDGADGQPLAIVLGYFSAAAFKAGGHVPLAKEFVRFLVGEGWLAHWLDFAGDRFLPPMPKLLDAPFWLNPSDQHRMAAAMQFLTRPRSQDLAVAARDWRYELPDRENVWGKAVQRVAVEGVSPEQAVDEAIARIKQILSK
jgi:multiple sugar transport system substrate-binding protein